MNKTGLIRAVAKKTGVTLNESRSIIEATIDVIQEETAEDKVVIQGFGTFSKVHSPACVRRNPANGGTVNCAAVNKVKFKAGTNFKAAVNV